MDSLGMIVFWFNKKERLSRHYDVSKHCPSCVTQKLSEIQWLHGLLEGRRPKTQGVQLVLRLLDAQRQLQPEGI